MIKRRSWEKKKKNQKIKNGMYQEFQELLEEEELKINEKKVFIFYFYFKEEEKKKKKRKERKKFLLFPPYITLSSKFLGALTNE